MSVFPAILFPVELNGFRLPTENVEPSPKPLHCTLAHIKGEQKDYQLKEIRRVVERVVREFSPFTISFNRLCLFGDRDNPNIIALCSDQPNEQLYRLATMMRSQLISPDLHQSFDFDFNAHVSMATLLGDCNPQRFKCPIDRPLTLLVDQVCLVESRGHRPYNILSRHPLRALAG